jgi:hypothetical protein
MLVHLLLALSLTFPLSIPDGNSIRNFAKKVPEYLSTIVEAPKPLEEKPHDPLRYRGPRETLDGWKEGPLIG